MNIPVASLFNLAGPDLLIILLIVLLLFGAKKLPELAKGMGQAVREFNRAKDEFEREMNQPGENAATVKPAPGKQAHLPAGQSAAAAEAAPVPVPSATTTTATSEDASAPTPVAADRAKAVS